MLEIATAIWQAWRELNAIRARDGVPYTHMGWKDGISEEYFSRVVDDCAAAYKKVTGQEIQPWPPNTIGPLAGLDWETIITAPRDGSRVLVGAAHADGPGTWYCIACFLRGQWVHDLPSTERLNSEPTHWCKVRALP